ncbi:hypothetical protein WMY93_032250, partial [Mugilogobius chulae]
MWMDLSLLRENDAVIREEARCLVTHFLGKGRCDWGETEPAYRSELWRSSSNLSLPLWMNCAGKVFRLFASLRIKVMGPGHREPVDTLSSLHAQ